MLNPERSKSSTFFLSSALVKAVSEQPITDLPALTLVDLTYLFMVSTDIVNGFKSLGFMLDA